MYSRHAVQRMFSRGIGATEVEEALRKGECIEAYPTDQPYPSYLYLAWSAGEPLHVVVALLESERRCIIVTVYRPSPDQWSPDYRMRKKS